MNLAKLAVGRGIGDFLTAGGVSASKAAAAKKAANQLKRDAANYMFAQDQLNRPAQVDPYAEAQMAAMKRLRQISEGGETPEEKAQREALATQRQQAYGEAKRQLQGQISSQFEANKANMARRGIGGGGAEIAQNVAAQQATGNAMGAMGQQQAGQEAGILAEQGMQAQRRRDAATQALGEMAAGQQAMRQQGQLAMMGGAANLWNQMQARKQQRYLTGQQLGAQAISGLTSGIGYGLAG